MSLHNQFCKNSKDGSATGGVLLANSQHPARNKNTEINIKPRVNTYLLSENKAVNGTESSHNIIHYQYMGVSELCIQIFAQLQ